MKRGNCQKDNQREPRWLPSTSFLIPLCCKKTRLYVLSSGMKYLSYSQQLPLHGGGMLPPQETGWATGLAFQQKLAEPVDVLWTNNPLAGHRKPVSGEKSGRVDRSKGRSRPKIGCLVQRRASGIGVEKNRQPPWPGSFSRWICPLSWSSAGCRAIAGRCGGIGKGHSHPPSGHATQISSSRRICVGKTSPLHANYWNGWAKTTN